MWHLESFLAFFVVTQAELCLPEGIPEAERLHVLNSTNQQSAIQLATFKWPGAVAQSKVAEILISEVLGYHVSVNFDIGTLVDGISSFGCFGPDCETQHGKTNLLFDVWVTEVAQFFANFQLENPQVVEDLGPVGYEGSAGMYVRGSEREQAEADSGLPLEYYKSYNLSFHEPYNYFETLWDLNSSELRVCNEIDGLSSLLRNFLDWTGDVEGVTERNGQYYLNCPLPAFWIAPSCRHNYTRCIPTVMSGPVTMPTFMQWSVAHGLPLAITLVDTRRFPDANIRYIRKHKTLYYFYSPEASMQDLKASRIILPQHNPEAWAKGDYRTDSNKVNVAKLGSPLLRISAPRVRAFVQKMQVNEDQIVQLMTITIEGRVPDPERSYSNFQQGICEWLKANRDLWKSWIPMATDCTAGFGIADAQGMPVASRAEAVSCEICPAGRFSEVYEEDGLTYRCQPCDPGYHQTRLGQLNCVPCDPGAYAAEAGQAFCSACARGSFANLSASRSCLSCGPAEAWTTSKAEDAGGQERWIEIEGEVCAVPVHSV